MRPREWNFVLKTFQAKFDQSQIGLCDHCGEEDALERRALICSHFGAARKLFQALTRYGIGVCWRVGTQKRQQAPPQLCLLIFSLLRLCLPASSPTAPCQCTFMGRKAKTLTRSSWKPFAAELTKPAAFLSTIFHGARVVARTHRRSQKIDLAIMATEISQLDFCASWSLKLTHALTRTLQHLSCG